MKQKIDLQTWPRKSHFDFFRNFEEPFYGVCVDIDCQIAYEQAKSFGTSLFLYYLHKSIRAVNDTEAFCYRMEGEDVFLYDQIDASATINREDGTFGFSYIPYHKDYRLFEKAALLEIEKVRAERNLEPGTDQHNVIHYSSLPWLKFTSLSHARHFPRRESVPKITFGKITQVNGRRQMPVSIHVHHALVDGLHIGVYVDRFQRLLNER
ncbi:MAG: chloramphenicol O-acetyltransferase type A [Polaribacter sp.]|jgi:chloramphenicol O-acetyltransferase type A